MKVVYADGTVGKITQEEGKNLYIHNRFTKSAWKELEDEMIRLNIVKFDEPNLSKVGFEMISLEFVRDKIASAEF